MDTTTYVGLGILDFLNFHVCIHRGNCCRRIEDAYWDGKCRLVAGERVET